MYSAYKLNKQSDDIQPWCTPFPNCNQSVVPCPVLIVVSWPAYRLLRRQLRWFRDIIGISELKWTGMGKFNSGNHYIYYCRQESLRRNGVAIIVNKRVWNAVLGCNLKNDRMISIHFQGKPFSIIVIQVYAPICNAEEAEVEWFYEDLQDHLELIPKKDVFFIIGDWKAKVGSQENRQVWLWSTEWIREKANRVLPREHTGHSKHPLPKTQEKTLHVDITRWSIPKSYWLHSL